jgi:hypothetical protein
MKVTLDNQVFKSKKWKNLKKQQFCWKIYMFFIIFSVAITGLYQYIVIVDFPFFCHVQGHKAGIVHKNEVEFLENYVSFNVE